MLKVRIIPVLTFNGFALVKTIQFKNPRMLGNPVQAARVFNSRGVDELIFLDIVASKQNRKINYKIVKEVIKECFMPVGIGGGINTLEDIHEILKIGADKVVIKTAALTDPEFIKTAAHYYGSQCISIAVDAYKHSNGTFMVHNDLGIEISAPAFARQMQDAGAGEIILSSVDNDGMMKGFDLDLYRVIEHEVKLPLVFVGGGGDMTHYEELFRHTNCDAVGSASIFNFSQYTPLDIKKTLSKLGKPVRI